MNPIVAAIQMTSLADVPANLAAAERLLREAARGDACVAVLPENFAFMGARDEDKLAQAEEPGRGPIQSFLAGMARSLGLWVVAGTVPLRVPGCADKVFAASLVYDAHGACCARYDKMHLFDVAIQREDRVEEYRESATIAHGDARPVVAATPAGALGLSVCYDLRFPELYRALAGQGAELLSVPSAFTDKTGEAHWELLLRARAVENQCFVIAPDQCGRHANGRRTWGHSMIVDPWGKVLAQRAEDAGVVLAELPFDRLRQIRQALPVFTHRRLQ